MSAITTGSLLISPFVLRSCGFGNPHCGGKEGVLARQTGVDVKRCSRGSSLGARTTAVHGLHLRRAEWFRGSRSTRGNALRLEADNGYRCTAGQWLENVAQVEADAPLSVAWDMWMDRERIPRFMPWIDSVVIQKDTPELSRWTLKYKAFGQDLEFSWLAKNLTPIHHQKIHWKAMEGVPNRGAVRFFPRSSNKTGVQLVISYEVPQVLVPFASALKPLVDSVIQKDLDLFAELAKEEAKKAQSTA